MEPLWTWLLGVFNTVFSPLNTAIKVTKVLKHLYMYMPLQLLLYYLFLIVLPLLPLESIKQEPQPRIRVIVLHVLWVSWSYQWIWPTLMTASVVQQPILNLFIICVHLLPKSITHRQTLQLQTMIPPQKGFTALYSQYYKCDDCSSSGTMSLTTICSDQGSRWQQWIHDFN